MNPLLMAIGLGIFIAGALPKSKKSGNVENTTAKTVPTTNEIHQPDHANLDDIGRSSDGGAGVGTEEAQPDPVTETEET